MGSLNIKTPEAHQLAKELAELTGESMAVATTEALRERRDRILREHGARANRFRMLAREIGQGLPPEMQEGDPSDFLYDKDGLPFGS